MSPDKILVTEFNQKKSTQLPQCKYEAEINICSVENLATLRNYSNKTHTEKCDNEIQHDKEYTI